MIDSTIVIPAAKRVLEVIRTTHSKKRQNWMVWAKPYAEALVSSQVNWETGKYIAEDVSSIITYLLSNMSTWRGPLAIEVKAELRRALEEDNG
jgi:hypothetical protein